MDKKQEQPLSDKVVQEKPGIVLPTVARKATHTNPSTLALYGKAKVGKTTALSELPGCLLIDMEKGAGYVDAIVMSPPEGMGPVSTYKWLKDIAAEIRKQGKPYDYVAVDTLTQLDILSEAVGTYNYMNSVAGKAFNRKDGVQLKPSDPNYESVLTLGNGYGYRYTREAFMDIFETLKGLGRISTIFVCHVADKMIANKNGEEVMIKDLALTGKLRDMLPRIVDAVGNVWNEEGQVMVSFKGDNEKLGGIRGKHLAGYSGPLDWNRIFVKEESK
jgi:hypothetical protein